MLAYLGTTNRRTGGILAALFFIVYLISIAYAIYRGVATPLEDLGSDSSSDSEGGGGDVMMDSERRETVASEMPALLNDQQTTTAGGSAHLPNGNRPRVPLSTISVSFSSEWCSFLLPAASCLTV